MRDWLSFWNAPNRIYVNERHRDVHYRDVALAIRGFVPGPQAAVIDYGCGEATRADLVAAACRQLTLSDGAGAVRGKLSERFAAVPNIAVKSPDEIAALPAQSADLIVMNSVAQYLDRKTLDALLATFRRLLTPAGTLVVGDVIPPHTSLFTEIGALMRLAWRNGFVLAAFGGLARTLFSEYRKLRTALGLAHYTEAEFLGVLAAAGFQAARHRPNIEHNQQRMTFVARPVTHR
jgi:SAM-dependent methyltransferase